MDSITNVMFVSLIISSVIISTADCRGEETENQKLSPEAYAQSIKYETPEY
jgi:hypothetical protein